MRFVYLAYPIDQRIDSELIDTITTAKAMLMDLGVDIVFDPGDAFTVRSEAAIGREISHVNQVALRKASGVLAFLPAGSPTIGVPMEIWQASRAGVPVAVVTDVKSWALAQHGITNWDEDNWEGAVGWLASQADQGSIQSRDDNLLVKVADGGHLPTKSHFDDAGWDLYCQDDVTILPGEFRDIDCGVAVRFPFGLWGMITGRSSTLRKRGLLVNQGVIDTGYTGPLFAGVYNLTDKEVVVRKDERIAQMLLFSNWQNVEVRETDDLGVASRGTAGFGSTGQ